MWSQTYITLGGLVPSALLAALPVVLMLYLLGVARKPSWVAGLSGCAIAFVIALAAYRMPLIGDVQIERRQRAAVLEPVEDDHQIRQSLAPNSFAHREGDQRQLLGAASCRPFPAGAGW